MRRLLLLGVVLAALLLAGCSDEPAGTEVEGRVTAATGASSLESFVVTEDDGGSMQFAPGPGFNRSLEELRDLVISGERVFVEFETGPEGERVALSLEEK